MSNYNQEEENENDPNVVAYKKDMAAQQNQNTAANGNGTTTVNVSGSNTQQQQQQQVSKKRPDGWKTEDGKMWRWDNYYTLPDEYKKFLEPKNTKGKLDPAGIEPPVHVDPFDGKTYKFWVAFFDNGGSRISCMEWNTTSQGSSSGGTSATGGQKKSFYKTIDLEEGNIDQVKAFYASVRDNKKIMFKRVDSVPITATEIKPDGTRVTKQELRHVLELQERIDY